MCYMRTISQRELRNDNAEVIRRVLEGESLVVTRRGVPVARLTAYEHHTDLRCVRPAKRRLQYSSFARVRRDAGDASSAVVLQDLRGDR
jgi:prevent-host-death family protein